MNKPLFTAIEITASNGNTVTPQSIITSDERAVAIPVRVKPLDMSKVKEAQESARFIMALFGK